MKVFQKILEAIIFWKRPYLYIHTYFLGTFLLSNCRNSNILIRNVKVSHLAVLEYKQQFYLKFGHCFSRFSLSSCDLVLSKKLSKKMQYLIEGPKKIYFSLKNVTYWGLRNNWLKWIKLVSVAALEDYFWTFVQ